MNAGGQILGHIIHTVIQHGNRLHLMERFVGGRLRLPPGAQSIRVIPFDAEPPNLRQ